MIKELGITSVTLNFIQLPNDNERVKVANFIASTLKSCASRVIEYMAEKEGKKGDAVLIEMLMRQHGQDAIMLSHRILDEMMIKEFSVHHDRFEHGYKDFSKMYMKEIFLKGVFVCAMECVFFVNVVKNIMPTDLMKVVNIKPFDIWRLMSNFLKFDNHMPRLLMNYFKDLESKIVSEIAWQNGSPVVEVIKTLIKN